MPRPDGRLDPGEPLRVSARAWNRAQDAADIVLGLNSGVKGFPNQSSPAPFVWVLGKNTTSGTIDRFACLSIAGLEVTPVEDEDDKSTIDFLRGPVLSCGSPTAGGTVVVAIDPIKPGKIGRVAVAGVVQARTADLAKVEGYEVLWNDATWALIRIGGGDESYTWAWVLNTTSSTVPKFGNMRIDRLANASGVLESSGAPVWNGMVTNEQAAATPTPVFTGVYPWVHPTDSELVNSFSKYLTYGIALHDIAPNTMGRVAVSGIVAARVKDWPTTTEPTGDNVRLAGPCITGGNTLEMLEAGWGPHEIVSPQIPSPDAEQYPLYMVRVNAHPFRVYAKGYSDDIGSGGLSTGGTGPLVVQLGDIGAERDAKWQSIYPIRVRVKAIYGPVKPGKRCLVEPGPGGTFVVMAVEP